MSVFYQQISDGKVSCNGCKKAIPDWRWTFRKTRDGVRYCSDCWVIEINYGDGKWIKQ